MERSADPRPACGTKWSEGDVKVRLHDGCHLYRGPDDLWRLHCPDGRFIRLRLGCDSSVALVEIVQGRRPVADVLAEVSDPKPLCMALDSMLEQGLLRIAGVRLQQQRAGRVALVGANPVASAFSRILAEAAVDILEMQYGEVDDDGVDLVVACAGWLPDRWWRSLGSWCATRGIPWHMCHVEGTRFYVGPISIPDRTAGYADTRARRLAAAVLPDELEAYWAYLDAQDPLPDVPWPSQGVAAIIAGLLAADTLAVLAGEPPPSDGAQLEVDPARLSVRHHPVLPLPREILAANPKPDYFRKTVGHDRCD